MKTLSKALAILEELNKTDEPISVSQIGKLLNINTTTVSRLMRVFKEAGYVKQGPNRRYQLDLGILHLTNSILKKNELVRQAVPYMGKLLHEVGHAVFLGVIWRSTELNLFRISEIDMPIFGVSASYSSPITGSSIAKVILAFQPEEKVLEIYKNADVRTYTDRTITSLDVYLKEMEKVRMAGYGINDEEIHPGIRSLAGPIRRFDSEVIAGLSVGGYIPMEDLLRLAPKVLDYCRMISFSLGYNAESMPKV